MSEPVSGLAIPAESRFRGNGSSGRSPEKEDVMISIGIAIVLLWGVSLGLAYKMGGRGR